MAKLLSAGVQLSQPYDEQSNRRNGAAAPIYLLNDPSVLGYFTTFFEDRIITYEEGGKTYLNEWRSDKGNYLIEADGPVDVLERFGRISVFTTDDTEGFIRIRSDAPLLVMQGIPGYGCAERLAPSVDGYCVLTRSLCCLIIVSPNIKRIARALLRKYVIGQSRDAGYTTKNIWWLDSGKADDRGYWLDTSRWNDGV